MSLACCCRSSFTRDVVLVVVVFVVLAVAVFFAWYFVGEAFSQNMCTAFKSFYVRQPPQLFLNENAGFETSSRPYLLNTVPLATPTSSFDSPFFANYKTCGDYFLTATFLVSSSHETFVEENRRFWGGLS